MKNSLKHVPGYIVLAICAVFVIGGFAVKSAFFETTDTHFNSCFVTGGRPAKPSFARLPEAEKGDAWAQMDMGRYYQEKYETEQLKAKVGGPHTQENLYFQQAVAWYLKAAKQQQKWAQALLGDIYLKHGNSKESYAWFLISKDLIYDPKKMVCAGMDLDLAMKRVEGMLSRDDLDEAYTRALEIKNSLLK